MFCELNKDKVRKYLSPALYLAIKQNKEKAALTLLKWGALTHFFHKTAPFPIVFAAYKNMKDVVGFLVDQGVDIDTKAVLSGNTSVMIAVHRKYYDLLDFLVKEGADICIKNAKRSPIEHAIIKNDLKSVRILAQLQYWNVDICKAAIEFAKKQGRNEIANYLNLVEFNL